MKVPSISVIAAVHNGGKYLPLAMDSVLNQTFKDMEFVIVDDASTDETPAVVAARNDERVVYIRNQKNLGQTSSLNVALRAAKGKYVARMDADDLFLPEKLEKQFEYMEKNPDVAVCGTAGIKIDEEGREIAVYSPPLSPRDVAFNIFFRSPVIHVSVLCRRSALLEMGGYDERYPYRADFALWSKIIKNHRLITNLPDKLTKYRELTRSASGVQKLTSLEEETVEIIHSNITDLLKLPIDKNECHDIVFLLFPSSGINVPSIVGAYLNLRIIARKSYGGRIPPRISMMLHSMLYWSLTKRAAFMKSQNPKYSAARDFFSLGKFFFRNPMIPAISSAACLTSLLGEKRIFKIKKWVSRFIFGAFHKKRSAP